MTEATGSSEIAELGHSCCELGKRLEAAALPASVADFARIGLDLTGPFWTKRRERMSLARSLEMPNRRFNAEQFVVLPR